LIEKDAEANAEDHDLEGALVVAMAGNFGIPPFHRGLTLMKVVKDHCH